MSAPKHNPFCIIEIYRAPDHSSREEFEKNMAKLMHDIKLLPVAQNNMLKLNVVRRTSFLSTVYRHEIPPGVDIPKRQTFIHGNGAARGSDHRLGHGRI
jgi:hypothetical protein